MTLLHLQSLGLTLAEPVFTDLTVTLTKGDRLGLVAANGRGKTTLLNCLTGGADPTTGEIIRGRGVRIGYVCQTLPEGTGAMTPYELALAALPSDQADYESWRVDVVLGELGMPYELQHQALSALSGGWQRMAMLAAEWVVEPDILLLDEPTNHLDLHRIGQLQEWLAGLPRDLGLIITSHDRAFLDATTNRTLFLRAERSRVFPLPFSHARAALDEADAADERRFANDLNKAKTLRRQAAKLKNVGINSGSDLLLTKTKQLTERAEKMEAAARPAHQERSAGDIKLANSGTHAKALLTLPDVEVTAPDGRGLYRTGQKWISPGERVVLLG
ncbi:MAG: ATP-binding cassette domain-containing protein, partial [Pseudomonadota bacterium]